MKKSIIEPLVYNALTSFPFIERDFDALTLYELLSTIIGKLNEAIGIIDDLDDDIEQKVTEKLNEWLEDGTLEQLINETIFNKLKIFYVPEDFGGVGDGETDCTDAFDKACKAMRDGNIKMLHIPANKTYLIKHTIAIPEGCTVFGSGSTSRIYFDETDTHIGTGIGNGGSNVTIENLRVDQKSTGKVTYQAQPGAMGIGTRVACGAMLRPSTEYEKANMNNITYRNIWSNGQYPLQTEPASDTVVEGVTCENIYAPIGLVSFISRQKRIKNLVYRNIVCDTLRLGGSDASEEIDEGVVDGFSCHHLRLQSAGTKVTNGIVDCSVAGNNDEISACTIRTHTIIDHVNMIGGYPQYEYAFRMISPENTGGQYTVTNSRIRNFPKMTSNYYEFTDPIKSHIWNIENSYIWWTGTEIPPIQGTIRGGYVKPVISPYPLAYFDQSIWVDNSKIGWTTSQVSARYPKTGNLRGDKFTIRALCSLSGLPEDNAIIEVPEEYKYHLIADGGRLPVTLYNADYTKSTPTTAIYTASTGKAILQTDGITLSDYTMYEINELVNIHQYKTR